MRDPVMTLFALVAAGGLAWFATAGPRPCDAQSRPPAVAAAELPAGFGKLAYLADLPPGTWVWSESQRRVYLVLDGGRYCDPATGECWEFKPESACGFPVKAHVSITRPSGLDLRPWTAPERPAGESGQ
jgi:hypothetical protein